MNIKNIKFGIERNNESKTHYLKLLDADTNMILAKSEEIDQQLYPELEYNNIIFKYYNNKIWLEYNSILEFINKPKIIEEIKPESNEI